MAIEQWGSGLARKAYDSLSCNNNNDSSKEIIKIYKHRTPLYKQECYNVKEICQGEIKRRRRIMERGNSRAWTPKKKPKSQKYSV